MGKTQIIQELRKKDVFYIKADKGNDIYCDTVFRSIHLVFLITVNEYRIILIYSELQSSEIA